MDGGQRARRLLGALVTAAPGVPTRAFLAEGVLAALREETARGRLGLWAVPALWAGAALYFKLPADPPLVLLGPAAAFAVLAAIVLRERALAGFVALLFAVAGAGMLAGFASVKRAEAPRIERVITSATVTGRVLRVEPRAERAPRVLLLVAMIEGGGLAALPERLVLVGRGVEGARIGDALSVRARLSPLPGPTHPGAYDPAFPAFFDKVGGYAFPLGRPVTAQLPPPGIWLSMLIAIEAWRTDLTERIVTRLGPEVGPVAAALVTGQRTAISEDLRQDFNASGLMHVLSISGLHMALVAGGMFWLLRALLAAIPSLALRLPIKKIAALGALATATFYEIASGAEVATTRSYIMIVIVFLAVLLDRPAITMRNLALAGALIALVMPQSVLSASFQMSFAATAALVAGIERGLIPRLVHSDQPLPVRLVFGVVQLVVATALISLLCELAILPIQLHHFHRVTWFGLVGNVLALMVVDTIIMPAALATLILMPLGLGDWGIPILGFGVERMIDIARFVAAFPSAVTQVAGFSPLALVVSLAGVAWATIWRTRLALLAFAPYLAGFALWTADRPPDVRISANGEILAARGEDGRLTIDARSRDEFVVRRWLETDGDMRAADDASLARHRRCDAAGCTIALRSGLILARPRDAHALAEDCRRADILVLSTARPPDCPRPRLVLDREAIQRAHGIAIDLSGARPRVTETTATCGQRPWCPKPENPAPASLFGRRTPAQ